MNILTFFHDLLLSELSILAIPNDASESKFFIFYFRSDVKLIPSNLFVSGYSKIFFRIFTPLVDGFVIVGIRSSFCKSLYFLPFGNSSSFISSSCAVGFLLGIIVSKCIKSFTSSSPKSIKSFSKFSVRSNSSCGLWGLSVIANIFSVFDICS